MIKQYVILFLITTLMGCGDRADPELATVGIYDNILNYEEVPLSIEMTCKLTELVRSGGELFTGFDGLKIAEDSYMTINGKRYYWYGPGGFIIDESGTRLYHSSVLVEFWSRYNNDRNNCRMFIPK